MKHKRPNHQFTTDQQQYIKDNYLKQSLSEMAKAIKSTKGKVQVFTVNNDLYNNHPRTRRKAKVVTGCFEWAAFKKIDKIFA